MPWAIDNRFRIAANRQILAHLDKTSPSAHDDVASALVNSAKELRGVQHYCPNPSSYAWQCLHTKDHVIFAFATGMNTVAFRLPASSIKSAMEAGGIQASDLGADWIEWQLGWDMDLRPWTKLALELAEG